jgi:hypothetical protein
MFWQNVQWDVRLVKLKCTGLRCYKINQPLSIGEYHKRIGQDRLFSGRNSNLPPPEYEADLGEKSDSKLRFQWNRYTVLDRIEE